MNTQPPRDRFEAAFARQVISPPPGVALAGYFAPRFNRGILDDLWVRVALFRSGETTTGLVHFDLLELPLRFCRTIRERVAEEDPVLAENLILSATHTHTGPETRLARDECHEHALNVIVDQAVAAVRTACWRFAETRMETVAIRNNPFAFNRRYWMKDGSVVTNPGKLHPDIVRPEGPVDEEIQAVLFHQFGRPAACFVNVSNHTDTMGGDLVSADWPGVLERRFHSHFEAQLPVFAFISPAGNINHFDVTRPGDQTSPAEAKRIGCGYADIILQELRRPQPLEPEAPRLHRVDFPLQKRRITKADLEAARRLVTTESEDAGIFTSEDLAKGSPAVLRYFAKELLAFAATEAGMVEHFPVMALSLGPELALVSLPGEPFAEIGMEIREKSPFSHTLVISNANGYAGYIVLDECFDRGGYEPLPVQSGGADKGMAARAVECALTALRHVASAE